MAASGEPMGAWVEDEGVGDLELGQLLDDKFIGRIRFDVVVAAVVVVVAVTI